MIPAIIILTGCVISAESDASSATITYLTALAGKDKPAVANLSCKSWEEQAALEVDALLSVGAELDSVECSVTGEEDPYTLVNCQGGLNLTYGDEVRTIDLSRRTYYMLEEDGQWRVCSYE